MGAHYFDIEDKGFVMDRDALNFTFRFALPDLRQSTGGESFPPDPVGVMEDMKTAPAD